MRTSETTFFYTDNKRVQVSQRQFVFAKSIKLILRNDLRHFFFGGRGGGVSRAGCDVNSRTRCFCISHLLVFVGKAKKVVRSPVAFWGM